MRTGFPRVSRTFDTRSESELWAATIESEMGHRKFVPTREAESTTVTEALDRYEREITQKKKGIKQETSRLRILKRSILGKMSLIAVQGKDIARYRDGRMKEVSPATVRRELTILSHVFKIAIKEWSITGLSNPVQLINLPSGRGRERDRRLYSGELDRILRASASSFLSSIARIAIESAMRQEEISGLEWNRVDLKKKTVTLPDTKNGKKRIVPLSPEAIGILSDLPHRIDGKVWGIAPHSVSTAWRRAVKSARATYEKECREKKEKPDPAYLVDLTFHDLRHEATSLLFEMGFHPMEVASITGHETLKMLKRYTHLRAEDLAERMKRKSKPEPECEEPV